MATDVWLTQAYTLYMIKTRQRKEHSRDTTSYVCTCTYNAQAVQYFTLKRKMFPLKSQLLEQCLKLESTE